MKLSTRRYLVTTTLTAALFAAAPACDWAFADNERHGRDDDDHEQVFRARRGGSIIPLAEIMAMFREELKILDFAGQHLNMGVLFLGGKAMDGVSPWMS
ncbi:MAG: hypothetical protein GY948_14910, partial [Alphaproteobacteria bacterium]|nr:hypothetical protein [Alphaproteobacteria bacterium]